MEQRGEKVNEEQGHEVGGEEKREAWEGEGRKEETHEMQENMKKGERVRRGERVVKHE